MAICKLPSKPHHIQYTMEYYSAIKRNEVGSFVEIDGPRGCHAESSKSERENNDHILTHIGRI